MAGLIFGIADFAASMGIRENVVNQNQNFHYAKQATVVAAKAAGLTCIGVPSHPDERLLEADLVVESLVELL